MNVRGRVWLFGCGESRGMRYDVMLGTGQYEIPAGQIAIRLVLIDGEWTKKRIGGSRQ